MIKLLVLLLALLAALECAAAVPKKKGAKKPTAEPEKPSRHEKKPTCRWTDPKSGTSYDLTELVSRTSYSFKGVIPDQEKDSYHAHDLNHPMSPEAISEHIHAWDDWDFQGYKYVVNLCSNVMNKPELCAGQPDAPAYQITVEGSGSYQKHPPSCFALGNLGNVSFSLLNQYHPRRGIVITYEGGEPCMTRKVTYDEDGEESKAEWVSVPRKFSWSLPCDHSDKEVEGHIKSALKVIASEVDMCEYNVRWPTRYGCPVDTHVGSRHGASAAQTNLLILLSLMLFGVGGIICMQVFRHRVTIKVLLPKLVKGEKAAFSQLFTVLLPGEDDVISAKPPVHMI
mmetsp:Transcript_7097/g.26109  ORF Transcript_7097/g.26109 Transcript_7097/m.26109 type:complete len:340 (+) Transcript_7097:57-1076(+)